jgi:hypothetical protein
MACARSCFLYYGTQGVKARLRFEKGEVPVRVQVSEFNGNITGSNPTFTDIVRKSKGRQKKHL